MDSLVRQLYDYVSRSNLKSNEIELRFSEIYERNAISVQTFERLIKDLSNSKDWKDLQYTESEVIIGNPISKQGSDIRRIKDGELVRFEKKSRIQIKDFYEYYIRFSESKEELIELNDATWSSKYMQKLQRNRFRSSFLDKTETWKLDLTKVVSYNDSTISTSFEVEMELVEKNMSKVTKSQLKSNLQFILQSIQNSKYIMPKFFLNKIISTYSTLLGQNPRYPSFAGPLPFTLTKNIFDEGHLSCGYSVTDKADGDRKLLLISNGGHTIIISRPKSKGLQYQHVGTMDSKMDDSLFDCEYVNNMLYIFDCVYIKGADLRFRPLDHRLDACNIMKNEYPNINLKIAIKTFFFAEDGKIIKVENGKKTSVASDLNIYTVSHHLWKTKTNFKYNLDGLIYTPINANYYNTSIYKWKDNDTVDFYVEHISTTQWKLYIAGLDDNSNYIHLPFSGLNGDGIFKLRKGRNIELIENKIFKSNTSFKEGLITVSASSAKKYFTKTIVEFKFYGSQLLPIRTRYDKDKANNIRAINDVWDSVVNPLTISTIKKGVYKSCIRQYHNQIKRFLINSYSSSKNVLDIGSGAGGDIRKYESAKIKTCVGIDIVNVEYEHNKGKFHFVKATNELYNVQNLLKNHTVKQFDVVNVFFAAHYFFKSDDTLLNFVKNINSSLKTNGVIILTFMDGQKIFNLLKDKKIAKGKILSVKHNDTVIYKIKKMYKDVEKIDDLSLVNQKIEVRLNGTKYFKSNASIEYLVNVNKFVEYIEPYGIKSHHFKSFSEFCKQFPYECNAMNPVERDFSFMNSFLILSKI